MDGTQPFWARVIPLHEPRKLLGLVFVVAVAIIWCERAALLSNAPETARCHAWFALRILRP